MKLFEKLRRALGARRIEVSAASDERVRRALVELAQRSGDERLWEALGVVMDSRMLALITEANGPAVPDAETKWLLGGASALASVKAELREVVERAQAEKR